MEWKKDSTALFFSNDRDPSRNPALLESYNFYNDSRYQDVATMAKRHPAFVLRTMSRDFKGNKTFLLSEVAKYYSYSIVDAQSLMTDFTVLGFVNYDTDKELVHLNDKIISLFRCKIR